MDVLRVAHRAGNDLALLAPAVLLGADLIEADVKLRRRRLEVRHGRTLGPMPWLWEPFYVVRDIHLQLADLRTAMPAGATLMLDLKGRQAGFGEQVLKAMTGAEPYVVCTRQWHLLEPFTVQRDVKVVHSARKHGELRRLATHLLTHSTWGVSLHRSLLSAQTIAEFRRYADVVMTWPIDSPEVYDEVVGLGANGVISNDLSALTRH